MTRIRRPDLRSTLLASGLLTAAGLQLGAAPAPGTIADGGDHCVGLLERVTAGSDETRLASETCFDTFSEALDFATGGSVRLVPGEVFTTDMLASGSSDGVTSTVIGVDYDYPNHDSSHATYIWQASAGCTPTSGWIPNSMPSGWNDRVSSAIGSSGCTWYGHYEDDNRGGSLRICNCATMGVMNNQTSSEWFKQ